MRARRGSLHASDIHRRIPVSVLIALVSDVRDSSGIFGIVDVTAEEDGIPVCLFGQIIQINFRFLFANGTSGVSFGKFGTGLIFHVIGREMQTAAGERRVTVVKLKFFKFKCNFI